MMLVKISSNLVNLFRLLGFVIDFVSICRVMTSPLRFLIFLVNNKKVLFIRC